MAKKSYQWRDPTVLGHIAIWVSAAFAVDLFLRGALRAVFGDDAIYANAVADFSRPQSFALLADLIYALLLIGVVPVLMWVYRVSRNAHSRGKTMAHSPVSAIVWFIVPFAGWFVPYFVMAEIWEKSAPNASEQRHPLVAYWWAAYVAFSLATLAGGYFRTSLAWAIITNLAGLAAAVLFALVVRRLTRMQIAAHEADLLTVETADVLQRVSN